MAISATAEIDTAIDALAPAQQWQFVLFCARHYIVSHLDHLERYVTGEITLDEATDVNGIPSMVGMLIRRNARVAARMASSEWWGREVSPYWSESRLNAERALIEQKQVDELRRLAAGAAEPA